jgi:Spy/CpxP family protein refolding chaperone
MKKRTAILSSLVVVTALSITTFAFAGPGHRRGGDELRGGHLGALGAIMHARQELDLSDQQLDELKSIFRDVREQNARYREQLRGGIDAVAATLLANPNDVAAAQALIDQQTTAERAVKANVLAATSKALNVLTGEQRTKLSTLVSEHKDRSAERRQRIEERMRERGSARQ